VTRVNTDSRLEEIGLRLFRSRRGGGPSDGLPIPAVYGPRAAAIRAEIRATIRSAPQVMVKVTGGGRGMDAIRAHLNYVSKRGDRDVEDQDGDRHSGREALRDLMDEWHVAGTAIPPTSHRREAFNIMLSMPRGTEPELVLAAARALARKEFREHRYAMVLHTHQANPHVHVVVRAEGADSRRLNPRKADLRRLRERFASELRSLGVESAATRQSLRGSRFRSAPLWVVKSDRAERPSATHLTRPGTPKQFTDRLMALHAWRDATRCLAESNQIDDRKLALQIVTFLRETLVPAARPVEREASDRAKIAGHERS